MEGVEAIHNLLSRIAPYSTNGLDAKRSLTLG